MVFIPSRNATAGKVAFGDLLIFNHIVSRVLTNRGQGLKKNPRYMLVYEHILAGVTDASGQAKQ